jgi:hypothetical protein
MSLGKTCAGPRFVRQIRAGPIFDRLGLGGVECGAGRSSLLGY